MVHADKRACCVFETWMTWLGSPDDAHIAMDIDVCLLPGASCLTVCAWRWRQACD